MPRKNIVWVASYPKSGNTWTRIFLANYLLNTKAPMPINQVHRISIGDSVAEFYRRVSNGSFDPTNLAATMALRPKVLRGIAANDADVNLVKTHLPQKKHRNMELIPNGLTRSAIYLLRDPCDMVLSYARHFSVSHERAVKSIARSNNIALGDEGMTVQPLGAWSDHVISWTGLKSFPVLVLRYEDLKADPQGSFSKVLTHLGVPIDEERLDRAIRFSSFDELKRQEKTYGFIEKGRNSEAFFVSGLAGKGRTELASELVQKIEADHGTVMRRYGYL